MLAAGYAGPLSLEVFNDVFRQADPGPTAVDAQRSLLALQEDLAAVPGLPESVYPRLACPPPPAPVTGYAFCEIGADSTSAEPMANLLTGMGFAAAARHTKQDVTAWRQGEITLLVSTEDADPRVPGRGHVAALGLRSSSPERAAQRAEALLAVPPVTPDPLRDGLPGVVAPDATRIYFCGTDDASWASQFEAIGAGADADDTAPVADAVASSGEPVGLTAIDHIAMTQPFDSFDEARLFYTRVVGLQAQDLVEYAAPFGLLRGRAMRSADGLVRVPLSTSLVRRGGWMPGLRGPQHIAFRSGDIGRTAQRLLERRVPLIEVPDNYYADLAARYDLDDATVERLRAGRLLYERDGDGELLHLYTEVIGSRVFFEVVQRFGGYDGYGASNAHVHIAAHHRRRSPGQTPAPASPARHRVGRTDEPAEPMSAPARSPSSLNSPTVPVRTSLRGVVEPFHVMEVIKAAALRAQTHGDVISLCAGQPSTPAPAAVLRRRTGRADLAGARLLRGDRDPGAA